MLIIALAAWMAVAVMNGRRVSEEPPAPVAQDSAKHQQKKYRTWEERKDSMRRVDSIRYAEWAKERQQRYDSARLADSLWRDSVGWRFEPKVKTDTILDLNTADTAELQLIRGIGSYTARQIIWYREQLGGYYSPEQLLDETFRGLRLDTLTRCFFATLDSLKPIDVNHSSVDRLQRHPYLRYRQAKAIYEFRRRQIRLNDINQLTALPELDSVDLERLKYYLCFE